MKMCLAREEVIAKVQEWRNQGNTIVFINGGFDILHAGHIKILTEAKAQGDKLLVAINTDAYLTRIKGSNRPVNTLEDRATVLAALACVDCVTSFSENTPETLISLIKPDVFVNGSEYGENCLEAPLIKSYGGRIHIVTLLPGRSTTSLLKKT